MNKSCLAVIGLYILLYIIPLGVRPMTIPDELRYAEIPREMLASGDFVVPHLDGLRYFEKPVLGYWLNAAAIGLFGENGFAVRFPSALAAGITALMVYFAVARFYEGHRGGILASAILLTCTEFFGIGVFSVLDSMFSMFVTGTMISFFFAYLERSALKRTCCLVTAGFFCGLAFLTKGFLAFVLLGVVLVPFMIWEGCLKNFFKIIWVTVFVSVMVLLPWGISIHLREHNFWNYFFWEEHIRRFMSDAPQHPQPFWFFIPVMAVGALPWTVLIFAVIRGVRYKYIGNPLVKFAVCWFVFPFLFFSVSAGKIGTYILPCFPPFVILLAVGLLNYPVSKKGFNAGAYIVVTLVALLSFLLFVSQATGFAGFRVYGENEAWKWIFGLSGLIVWAVLSMLSARAHDLRRKILLYSAAPVLFMFISHFIMPNQVRDRKAPGEFLLRNSNKITRTALIVSDSNMVHSVCWFYKRTDVYLIKHGGELSYGLHYDDSHNRLLSIDQFKNLAMKKDVTLIAKLKFYRKYKDLLPKPTFEDIDGGFVFAQFL